MIKSVIFKKDFRCFNQGDKFEFKPGINVLVGDQGCGKSTIIELIRSKLELRFNHNDENDSSYRAKSIVVNNKIDDLVEVVMDVNTKCCAYDFERESARDMSAFHFDMIGEQIAAMTASHGQGNRISMNRILEKVSKSKDKIDVVLLDEPDAAMSPRSCYQLLLIMRGLNEKWGKQVIVSAHNPIVIQGRHPVLKKESQIIFPEVLSLEDKMWVNPSDFMLSQLLDRELNAKYRKLEKTNEKEKKEK